MTLKWVKFLFKQSYRMESIDLDESYGIPFLNARLTRKT